MTTGKLVGFRGGFLNGKEISADLDKIFFSGTVPNPTTQVQQAGIDLTLARIIKNPFEREIRFGADGWVKLSPGRYWIEFNEIPRSNEEDYLFYLWPRSTHFRNGNLLAVGIGKVTGSKDGIMGAAIDVDNRHGLWLERNARICQATIESHTKAFLIPHGVLASSAPLTVETIFRYTSEARLGVTERHVETEEVDGGVVLGSRESYLVRFAEVVSVGNAELVTSLKDNPFPFLWAMGAVADPGYTGKLHACLTSSEPYAVNPGMPMLQLRMDRITPVDADNLYDGKYQGLGLSGGESTVVWYNPADPRAWRQARDMAPMESSWLP